MIGHVADVDRHAHRTLDAPVVVLVGAGTIYQDRQLNDVSSTHVGEQVKIERMVIDIDPVRIKYNSVLVTVPNAEAVVKTTTERGNHMVVVGRVDADQMLVVTEVYAQNPWKFHYVYSISLLAGIWVLVRSLRQWRLDIQNLTFQPHQGGGD